jgi:hypothetical protein
MAAVRFRAEVFSQPGLGARPAAPPTWELFRGNQTPQSPAPSFFKSSPFKLPFAPQVGLERGEHPEHVQEAFARRRAGVDRLLGGPQRGALGPHGSNDILQVADAPGEAINTARFEFRKMRCRC